MANGDINSSQKCEVKIGSLSLTMVEGMPYSLKTNCMSRLEILVALL